MKNFVAILLAVSFFPFVSVEAQTDEPETPLAAELRCLSAIDGHNALASGLSSDHSKQLPIFLKDDGWTRGGAVALSESEILLPHGDSGEYWILGAEGARSFQVPKNLDPETLGSFFQIGERYFRVYESSNSAGDRHFIQVGSVAEKNAEEAGKVAQNQKYEDQLAKLEKEITRARAEGREKDVYDLEIEAMFAGWSRLRVTDLSQVPIVEPLAVALDLARQELHANLGRMISTVFDTTERSFLNYTQGNSQEACSTLTALQTCAAVDSPRVKEVAEAEFTRLSGSMYSNDCETAAKIFGRSSADSSLR